MIEKGIIEKIEDDYTVRVRIPKLHLMQGDPFATPTEDLSLGCIAVQPGLDVTYNVGDIVMVTFEQNTYEDVCVLGLLYREQKSKSTTNPTVDSLVVSLDCKLPNETTIGDISYSEIESLRNIKGNLQQELIRINERLNKLEKASQGE